MEFASMSDLEQMTLFGQAGEELSLWDGDRLNLKRSPGRESVCSSMSEPGYALGSESPGPLPGFEDKDIEVLLREAGIQLQDAEDGPIIVTDPTESHNTQEPSEVDVTDCQYQESEAPSSPTWSTTDAESYFVPSPAPSSRKKRQNKRKATKVTVSTALLEPVNEDEEIPQKNKAAIQAKINREKKKKYIADLENENETLKKDNSVYKAESERLKHENSILQEEVAYLKDVLANQSTLSSLLKNIPNVKGVSLTSSFDTRKRSAHQDHDYGVPVKRGRPSASATTTSGGVCLHVADSQVSLEFCKTCAASAGCSGDSPLRS